MRVRLFLDVDINGEHAFRWEPSSEPGALDIPEKTLLRWSRTYSRYLEARAQWQEMTHEVDELLHQCCPKNTHSPREASVGTGSRSRAVRWIQPRSRLTDEIVDSTQPTTVARQDATSVHSTAEQHPVSVRGQVFEQAEDVIVLTAAKRQKK